jgi:hypothetical protein
MMRGAGTIHHDSRGQRRCGREFPENRVAAAEPETQSPIRLGNAPSDTAGTGYAHTCGAQSQSPVASASANSSRPSLHTRPPGCGSQPATPSRSVSQHRHGNRSHHRVRQGSHHSSSNEAGSRIDLPRVFRTVQCSLCGIGSRRRHQHPGGLRTTEEQQRH